MPPVGFEPAIPASEWRQTQSFESAATWIGTLQLRNINCALELRTTCVTDCEVDLLQVCSIITNQSTLQISVIDGLDKQYIDGP